MISTPELSKMINYVRIPVLAQCSLPLDLIHHLKSKTVFGKMPKKLSSHLRLATLKQSG